MEHRIFSRDYRTTLRLHRRQDRLYTTLLVLVLASPYWKVSNGDDDNKQMNTLNLFWLKIVSKDFPPTLSTGCNKVCFSAMFGPINKLVDVNKLLLPHTISIRANVVVIRANSNLLNIEVLVD